MNGHWYRWEKFFFIWYKRYSTGPTYGEFLEVAESLDDDDRYIFKEWPGDSYPKKYFIPVIEEIKQEHK